MGAGSSSDVPGGGTEGYHVLRVQEGSPGYKAGLEPFFDFIVSVENSRLDQDNDTLKEVLKANVEKPVKLLVYSSKTRKVREASITPSNLWGGQGLLGVSIRFCSFDGAAENVWHVLDVNPNSPSDIAGLRPHTDYIIGADTVLHDAEDFFNLIDQHENKALKLYVYNSETDGCREVTITPNNKWGGEGSIGCGIGYGYLHRIPVPDVTKPLKPPIIATTTAGIAAGFSEIPLVGGGSPAPFNANTGLETSLANVNLSHHPMTAPLLTNSLPHNLSHIQPVATPPGAPPQSYTPVPQPLQPHVSPMLGNTPTPLPPSQTPILPTVMSTHVASHSPDAMVATEPQNTPQLVTSPISNGLSHVTEAPQLDVNTQPATILAPEVSQTEPGVFVAKPVPLLTDITQGATPTQIQGRKPTAGPST